MRIHPSIPPTVFETFSRAVTNAPKGQSTSFLHSRPMMVSMGPNFANYGIENTSTNAARTATAVEQQKLVTGSILDLFASQSPKKNVSVSEQVVDKKVKL